MNALKLAMDGVRFYFALGLGLLFVAGSVAAVFVWLYPIPDEALVLYVDRERGGVAPLVDRRNIHGNVGLALKAHFVLMPAGRAKLPGLIRDAEIQRRDAEFRRLYECVEAAPACALTAIEYQEYLRLAGERVASR